MESTSDNRFDANFAAQIMLEIGHEQSLAKLLQKLVERVLERPHMVCAQVWLVEKGDLCASCPRRPECPDQSRCLHLAAAKANSIAGPGKGFGRLDPGTAREPLGVPPFGNVVVSGQQRAVPDLNKLPASPLDPDWMREEGIRGYAINPISYKGEALGAIISATREPFQDELRPWGRLIANHIGAAIANARAFEEIRLTGKRLEQANQKLARELAERNAAEQEIAMLSFALDKGREAACLIDDTARFHYVNEEACRLLGYTRAELLGLGVADIDPEFPTERWPDHWRDLKAQRSLTFESRHRTREGRLFPVEVSANYFEYGGRAYNLALVRDITERKQAEQALRDSEANLNWAQEIAHIGSWHHDIARSRLAWSDEVFRIFGMPRGTALGYETFLDRVYPGDRGRVDRAWAAALQGAAYDIEHRILVGDELKWVRERAEVEFDPQGKAVQAVGTVQDITESKRTAAKIAVRTSLLYALIAGLWILLSDRLLVNLVSDPATIGRFSMYKGWFFVAVTTVLFYALLRGQLRRWGKEAAGRMAAEEAVREQADLLNLTHDCVLVMDMEGVIKYWNRGATERYDWTAGQAVGRVVYALLKTVFPKPREEIIAEVTRTGRWEGELVHTRKDGTQVVVASRWALQRDEQGAPVAILETNNDITERKRAEEERRESAERFRAIADYTYDWENWIGVDGKLLWVNPAVERITGYSVGECMVMPDFPVSIVAEADREVFARQTSEAVRGSSRNDFEFRVRHKDDRLVWVAASWQPIYDSRGVRLGHRSSMRDITDRKRAEDALRRNETYLAEGQRLSHTGSWAWNPLTLETLYWSEEMFRIFGFNPLEGLPTAGAFWQRIHPEDLGSARELLMKAAHQSMDYDHEHRIVLTDGTVRHIHAIGHPVLDERGQLVEYVGTAIDVTERKLAEDELRKHRENLEEMVRHRTEQLVEAKARAEAANRAKSTFLASMSHELRTPLNAVLGFSRLLKKDTDVTPHQQESLDIIVRSGEHLLNLINNVLDMAKIESGRVALKESEVDLNQLLHEMQSLMGAGAGEKGLRFALEHDPDLPRFVAVDAGKLRQVLLNLLGNAIKYTDSGGVRLRARLASIHGSEEAKVRFEVEDSGPGISQQDCQRIFFPFVQLGDQAPAQAGTGLGLAICKQYVELMGGQIGVASKPGKGSVFYFEIPVRILPSPAEPEEPKHGRVLGVAEGQPRYRLLIVEDQPENRLLLRRLLDPLGFELREAGNGQEAVILFEQWHPDLIWMDIRMPVMDGLEAVRRIRANKAGADTKIIALTAHALDEESGPIMAAGCDDLVRKPFREQELFDALTRHLRLKFLYEKAPRQETTQEAPGLTLRPEQLGALPAQLLQDLRQAVVELDTARTQALIQQVTERDASLGQALDKMATQLDYQGLLKLLEKGQTL